MAERRPAIFVRHKVWLFKRKDASGRRRAVVTGSGLVVVIAVVIVIATAVDGRRQVANRSGRT